uniref:Reverse transcriptase domain-containing protein n=1 Tax=Xenopus tropicalis TaxID=8364 RepID=A0A6I8QUB5_XENTR
MMCRSNQVLRRNDLERLQVSRQRRQICQLGFMMAQTQIRILSSNVCSIKSERARFLAYENLSRSDAEVFFLQETRLATRADLRKAKADWRHGPSFWSIAEEPCGGVGILFRGGLDIKVHRLLEIQVGRCLLLDVTLNGRRFRLINVYGPQSMAGRRALLSEIRPFLHTSLPVVFAGDFNQVLRPEDRSGRIGKSESYFLNMLIQQAGLVDVATWGGRRAAHTYRCANRSSRLDMAFVRAGEEFTNVREVATEYSDHLTLSFTVGVSSIPASGRGLWRLSADSLEGESVGKSFGALLQHQLGRIDFYNSVSSWWEDAKCSFRAFFRKLSVRREGNKYKKYLTLLTKLESSISDGVEGSKITRLKAQIRECQYSRYKSLVQERDYGSFHSPDPFLNCRENVGRKLITGLIDPEGELQTSREGILGVVKDFYGSLFRAKALDKGRTSSFLEATPGPDVTNLDFEPLTAEITEDEVKAAIDSLAKKKAPGPDGLTAEFYKKFRDQLAPVLIEVFRDCLEGGILPPSMRESSLILLSKGKDPQRVENWRPIALLNTDRKLLARILFTRLILFSGTLLSPVQSCTVKGRSIFEAILTIREALELCKVQNIGCYFLSLDQAKAFDRVDHEYLWAVLAKYGIPGIFIRWLSALYKGAVSFPLINGWRGENFEVGAGVRQGCPLSPLLYVFAIDPFLRRLQAGGIKGLSVPCSQPLRSVAYADDVTVAVSCPEDVGVLSETIRSYSEASGSLVNMDKSQAFWSLDEEPAFPLREFSVAPTQIRILGIKFGKGDDCRQNWEEKLDAGNAKVQRWKQWRLSYSERVKLVKTYLVPIFLFVSYVYPLPEALYARIHSLFFQLIWGSRLNPVKRGVTYLQRKEGGLGMLCPVAFFGSIFLKSNFGCLGQRTDSLWECCVRRWVLPLVGDWVLGGSVKKVRVRGCRLPTHLQLGLKLLRKWDVGIGELGSVPRKQIYQRILATYFIVPLALKDCVGDILSQSLRWLNDRRVPSRYFDLNWLALQGKLFVRGNLRYLNIADRNCPWGCPGDETQEHFLVDCPVAKIVQCQLAEALKVPYIKRLSYADAAYGVLSVQHPLDRGTVYMIISVMRYHLWQSRCRRSFSQEDVIIDLIVKSVVADLGFLRERELKQSCSNASKWRCITL